MNVYYVIVFVIATVAFSFYSFFYKENKSLGLLFLFVAAFVLRLFVASLDPFLHDWDERFHALVAKNMMEFPFHPMLHKEIIFPYDVNDWCCNHVWVHKQPLFLWQMALSLKLFGTHVLALRLPSVLMSSLSILFIYDIARIWTKNSQVAYFSAFLFTFSYYNLELISGRFSLEHNDIAFAFYVGLSFWSLFRYLSAKGSRQYKWILMIGLFAGCAILNKWLTGLLVFGGWGLYVLLNRNWRSKYSSWLHIGVSLVVCCFVFVPWQIYINYAFPLETAASYLHNKEHIFEVLGEHSGNFLYHFTQASLIYSDILLLLIPFGVFALYKMKSVDKKMTWSIYAMIFVLYLFFTIVKTKMPAFTFPVSSFLWVILAVGFHFSINILSEKLKIDYRILSIAFLLFLGGYNLKWNRILSHRSDTNVERNEKLVNTAIYQNLILDDLTDRVLINCKNFEDVEVMFYNDINAYHWYPTKVIFDSLLLEGIQFAAFKSHGNQQLPDYISLHPDVLILDEQIK